MLTLVRILNRILAHIPAPRPTVMRMVRCPFCDTYRTDPTENCPTCAL